MDIARLGLQIESDGVRRAKKDMKAFDVASMGAAKAAGAVGLAIGGLLAAGAGIGAAVSSIKEYGKSMSQVQAITRASASEMQAMDAVARKLGASTEFSASQAADGLRFLGMAGFEAAEAISALPDVLDLATASGMGLAEAADTASNIMSGFGIAAEDAAEVADVLAAASSRANTDVAQLGQAMSTVAPISAALEISLADTAAAIGVLSDAGIQGARAGTAMRGVLAALAGPTDAAQAALASYGLSIKDVNPETRALTDIFGDLKKAGLSTADAMTIFGREAASGALVLVDAAARVGEFGDELRDVDGEAKRMAETMRDNLGGDVQSAISAMEGLALAIGDLGLTAALRFAVQGVTGLVRGITNLTETVSGFFETHGPMVQSVAAATFAMTDEANAALGVTEKLIAMGEQSRDVVGAKLALAEASLAVAEASRQEAIEASKSSSAYQEAVAQADHARGVLQNLQNMAKGFDPITQKARELTASQAQDVERFASQLRAAMQVQEQIVQAAGAVSPEYEKANAQVELLQRLFAQSVGDAANLGAAMEAPAARAAEVNAYVTALLGNLGASAGAASALGGALGGAANAALALANAASRANAALGGVASGLLSLSAKGQAAATGIRGLGAIAKGISTKGLTALSNGLKPAAANLGNLWNAAQKSEGAFTRVTKAIDKGFNPAIAKIGGSGGGSSGGAAGKAAKGIEDIGSAASGAKEEIAKLNGVLTSLFDAMGKGDLSNLGQTLLGQAGSSFSGLLKGAFTPGKDGQIGGLGAVFGGLKSSFTGIGSAFTSASAAAGGGISGAISGIGGAIGAAMPLIGAASFLISGFKKKTELLDQQLRVNIKGTETLTNSYKKVKETRFWGLSKKIKEELDGVSTTTSKAISDTVMGIRAGVVGSIAALGGSDASLNGFTARLQVDTKGMSAEEAAAALQQELGVLADQMAITALGTSKYTRIGETHSQALERLSTSLHGVNPALDQLGHKLFSVSVAGGAAASAFADMFGGVQAFQASASFYYENFYTEAERAKKAGQQIKGIFGKLGIGKVPATLEAYRKLIDRQSKRGNLERVAELMKAAPLFKQVFDYGVQAAEEAAQVQIDAAKEAADAFLNGITGKQFSRGIDYDFAQVASQGLVDGIDARSEGKTAAQVNAELTSALADLRAEVAALRADTNSANILIVEQGAQVADNTERQLQIAEGV